MQYGQGRMKRRGYATIYNLSYYKNGQGFMSKNSKEFITRALYTLDSLFLLHSLVGGWAKYSISC